MRLMRKIKLNSIQHKFFGIKIKDLEGTESPFTPKFVKKALKQENDCFALLAFDPRTEVATMIRGYVSPDEVWDLKLAFQDNTLASWGDFIPD